MFIFIVQTKVEPNIMNSQNDIVLSRTVWTTLVFDVLFLSGNFWFIAGALMDGGASQTDRLRMTLGNSDGETRARGSLHDQSGREQARCPSLGGATKRAAYTKHRAVACTIVVLCFALCNVITTGGIL